ncbi:MAG: hypothetical protein JWQ35_2195, partial [Bacteriovoracaceae bacterium]|nr:hypothetical protein [Bacteriovoracaceae bacterium]
LKLLKDRLEAKQTEGLSDSNDLQMLSVLERAEKNRKDEIERQKEKDIPNGDLSLSRMRAASKSPDSSKSELYEKTLKGHPEIIEVAKQEGRAISLAPEILNLLPSMTRMSRIERLGREHSGMVEDPDFVSSGDLGHVRWAHLRSEDVQEKLLAGTLPSYGLNEEHSVKGSRRENKNYVFGFVYDTSGSMEEDSRGIFQERLVKGGLDKAHTSIKSRGGTSSGFIMPFADRHKFFNFSNEKELRSLHNNALPYAGGSSTNLQSAIEAALQELIKMALQNPLTQSITLSFISDGDATFEITPIERMIANLDPKIKVGLRIILLHHGNQDLMNLKNIKSERLDVTTRFLDAFNTHKALFEEGVSVTEPSPSLLDLDIYFSRHLNASFDPMAWVREIEKEAEDRKSVPGEQHIPKAPPSVNIWSRELRIKVGKHLLDQLLGENVSAVKSISDADWAALKTWIAL